MHARPSLLITLLLPATLLTGCAMQPPTPAPPDARQFQGLWQMDLSPAQDRSYLKELVITPVVQNESAQVLAFTGTVYGGSPFDNGLVTAAGDQTIFSFVSDETGQMGGPYYWLGSHTSPTTLASRVQSLTRAFQLNWSATR